MPRTALSADEVAAQRARIIEAATHLFAERGYEAVTMRSIAAELGCSPMMPYRYFEGGKDEIFALVRAAAFSRFADRQQAHALAPGDPMERLRALARAYVEFALENPDAYAVMFSLHQDYYDEHPELVEQGLRAWLPMRTAVEQAVECGALEGDPDDLAQLCWAHVHGLVSLELAGKLRMGRNARELLEVELETIWAPGGKAGSAANGGST